MFGRGRRERSEEDRSGKQPEEFAGEGQTVGEAGDGGFHVTRRTALVGGAIGGAGLMGLGKLSDALVAGVAAPFLRWEDAFGAPQREA